MTELSTAPFNPERSDLTLQAQIPITIPEELRNLRLADQLPGGNVAYIDALEPDTLRLIDPATWKTITRKGVDLRLGVEANGGRKFSGIIFHTPSRTQEESYEGEIAKLAPLLTRTSKQTEGIITEQNLGTLFVVEDRGADELVGWREEQLRRNGLMVDRQKGEKAVVVTANSIISQGRRKKQHSAVDLTKGRISGNMFNHFTDAIERGAEAQGLSADTKRLQREARATKFPPKTLNNLREGGNTDYVGSDDSGNATFLSISRSGEETGSSDKEGFRVKLQPETVDVGKLIDEKKGFERSDLECVCGNHPRDYFTARPGRVRTFLFKSTVCNEPHPNGYPRYFEGDEKPRYLGAFTLPERQPVKK